MADYDFSLFNDEQREAFCAYLATPEHKQWDALSQIEIRHLIVMDAVQKYDPTFELPYPLAAADIAGDDMLYWPALPKVETVYEAMVALLKTRG